MNHRDKIISSNIALCLRFGDHLNEWESKFVESVNSQLYPLTANQFNRLQEITTKIKSKTIMGGIR